MQTLSSIQQHVSEMETTIEHRFTRIEGLRDELASEMLKLTGTHTHLKQALTEQTRETKQKLLQMLYEDVEWQLVQSQVHQLDHRFTGLDEVCHRLQRSVRQLEDSSGVGFTKEADIIASATEECRELLASHEQVAVGAVRDMHRCLDELETSMASRIVQLSKEIGSKVGADELAWSISEARKELLKNVLKAVDRRLEPSPHAHQMAISHPIRQRHSPRRRSASNALPPPSATALVDFGDAGIVEFPLSSSAEPSSPTAAQPSLRGQPGDFLRVPLELARHGLQSTSIADAAFCTESDDESTSEVGEPKQELRYSANDRNSKGHGVRSAAVPKERTWTTDRIPEQLVGPVRSVPVGLLAEVQVIRSKLQQASYTIGGQDWSRLFRLLDRDKNGFLSEAELLHAVRHTLHIPSGRVSAEATRKLFRYLDADRDGRIDLGELFRFLRAGQPDDSSGAVNLQCKPVVHLDDDTGNPHSPRVAEEEPLENSILIEGQDDDNLKLSAEIERLEAEVARTVYQSRLHGL
jgi:hypothetical protein